MTKRVAPSPRDAVANSFPTTNWSEIGRLDSPGFANAIAALCQQYWYPVYAYVRRRSVDAHQAEDLTQAFFAKVLARQLFRAADPDKGRFRSFLLTSVRNFLASEHAFQRTQRRGGNERVLSIDAAAAEQLYHRNRSMGGCPEEDFDRAWALTLLERAIDRLRDEYRDKQQSLRFELFVPSLESVPLDYDEIAAALAIDRAAARKAASRFRQRYGELLRDEISATLSDSGELEEEIAWMMRLFAR